MGRAAGREGVRENVVSKNLSFLYIALMGRGVEIALSGPVFTVCSLRVTGRRCLGRRLREAKEQATEICGALPAEGTVAEEEKELPLLN